jgi:hypothetical protein
MSTVVTPYNNCTRLQYFEHPTKPNEFISVDIFSRNIKPFETYNSKDYTENLVGPPPPPPTCKEGHRLVLRHIDKDKTKNVECLHLRGLDENMRENSEGWSCVEQDCES